VTLRKARRFERIRSRLILEKERGIKSAQGIGFITRRVEKGSGVQAKNKFLQPGGEVH